MNREIRRHRVGKTAVVIGRVGVDRTCLSGLWECGADGHVFVVIDGGNDCVELARALLDDYASRVRDGASTLAEVLAGTPAEGLRVWASLVDTTRGQATWRLVHHGGDVAGGEGVWPGHYAFDLGPAAVSLRRLDHVAPATAEDAILEAMAVAAPRLVVAIAAEDDGAVESTQDLRVVADYDGIERVELAFTSLATATGLSDRVRRSVLVALDDLLGNVVNYAYEDSPGAYFEVQSTIAGEVVRVTVRDTGPPFNPFALAEPDTTLDVDERHIGGLGVHLVRRLMDEVSYAREGDTNVVRIAKGRTLD